MSNVVHILTRRPLDERLGTSIGPNECLACFLARMVGAQTCAGSFAWTEHYRRSRAPRAVALERRLRAAGATCDCEVVDVVWRLSGRLLVREPETGLLVEPAEPPPCADTRSRSTKPCANWAPAHDVAL